MNSFIATRDPLTTSLLHTSLFRSSFCFLKSSSRRGFQGSWRLCSMIDGVVRLLDAPIRAGADLEMLPRCVDALRISVLVHTRRIYCRPSTAQ